MKKTKTIEVTKEEFKVLDNFYDMWCDDEAFESKSFGEFAEYILNKNLPGFDIVIKEEKPFVKDGKRTLLDAIEFIEAFLNIKDEKATQELIDSIKAFMKEIGYM